MANSGTASRVRPREAAGESDTRRVLIDAAVETLKVDGIARASARTIAGRAGCNQGLVFYHFGSVANLLLAALDAVSDGRLEHDGAAVGSVGSPTELVEVAASIFREDLDAGYVSVLVEMIAGSSSTPGLGAEVAGRIAPWMRFAQQTVETALADSPLGSVPPLAGCHRCRRRPLPGARDADPPRRRSFSGARPLRARRTTGCAVRGDGRTDCGGRIRGDRARGGAMTASVGPGGRVPTRRPSQGMEARAATVAGRAARHRPRRADRRPGCCRRRGPGPQG